MKKLVILLSLFFIIIPGALSALEESRDFKKQRIIDNCTLNLRNVGDKWFLFRKVFEAAIYLEKDANIGNILSDIPKRIEIHYKIKISGRRLAHETNKGLKKNTTSEQYHKIKERIVIMNTYFVDVKPGDEFANTYIPGRGTLFHLNGKLIGEIKGQDFGRAIFAVWLGGYPIDHKLKHKLLAKKNY